MKKIRTYPEMNEKILGILRLSEEPVQLYAAQRIEELEEEVSRTGRWIVRETDCGDYKVSHLICSECGQEAMYDESHIYTPTKHCPGCGVKMENG